MAEGKVRAQSELADVIEKEKASGKKIGFTNGCFDILHAGHVQYLGQAKKECDILVIGVNSDESVGRLKGESRPINNQFARLEVLAALECVDFLVIFEEDTPEDLIKTLTPDILFKGGDWDEDSVVGGSHVKKNGGKVKIIPYVEGYSTTELIERIKGLDQGA